MEDVMTTRIVLTSLFVYGALAASPVVSHANDRAEQTRIETKLKKDADLRGVTVKCERVVTLSGKVPSESDKIRAERLASLTGVSKVDNQIEVSDKVAKDRIDDQAEANKDRAQVRADIEKNRIDAEAEAAKARLDHRDTDKAHPTVGDDVSDDYHQTEIKVHHRERVQGQRDPRDNGCKGNGHSAWHRTDGFSSQGGLGGHARHQRSP